MVALLDVAGVSVCPCGGCNDGGIGIVTMKGFGGGSAEHCVDHTTIGYACAKWCNAVIF